MEVIHRNKWLIVIIYTQGVDFVSVEREVGHETQQIGKYNPIYNMNSSVIGNWFDDRALDERLIVNWKRIILLSTEMKLIDYELIRNCLTINWMELFDCKLVMDVWLKI